MIFLLLPLVLGLCSIGMGWSTIRAPKRARQDWVPVTGEVVGMRLSALDTVPDGPVVRFRTLDDREISGRPGTWVDIGYVPVGRSVPVWYDPTRPERFHARTGLEDGAAVVCIAVGVVLLCVTAYLAYVVSG